MKSKKWYSVIKYVSSEQSSGSFIGFRGRAQTDEYGERFTLQFGDCNKMVSWEISKKHGLEKIQTAIKVLQQLEKILEQEDGKDAS